MSKKLSQHGQVIQYIVLIFFLFSFVVKTKHVYVYEYKYGIKLIVKATIKRMFSVFACGSVNGLMM